MALTQPSKRPADTMKRSIVIAVDYGTTYSALAWAQTARPDIKATIVQWPDTKGSLEGQTSEKVPTELSYESGVLKWGFEISEDEDRHQWFKLGLDHNQEHEVSHLTINYPDPKALPPTYDGAIGAVQMTTDYLTCLRKHALNILKLKLGEGIISTTPTRFIITVPAIWDDSAKDRTRQCAMAAGMGNDVRIITEPEAAVVYALDALDPHNLIVGDKFVLCDAGGGTVDLITYCITKLQPTVEVREAVAGSGDACGSVFLNRIFRKYLEEQLCDAEGFDEDTVEDAMIDFETSVKRKFTGDETNIVVRVTGLADNAEKGIKRQKMTIAGHILKSLFDPVIATITTLVKSQLRQANNAKAVILVGGFGQSAYLRKCIEKMIANHIEVLQPANGWTAVVRGALIRALGQDAPDTSRIAIASRVARKAYGVSCSVSYDPTIHEHGRKYFDPFDGEYRIKVVEWFVEKGDDINENAPMIAKFYSEKLVTDGGFQTHEARLMSFASASSVKAPIYPCGDIQKIVLLTADLSSIPETAIPIHIGADGNEYYVLNFQIRVKFFSAHTEYSLWHKDKEYGKVNAEYA